MNDKTIPDERIIELFFSRSDSAISCVADKYGGKMHALSYNIVGNRLDAEECVNDAYLAMWNAIPPARPLPLSPYAYRVTRNLSLSRYRYNTAEKRNTSSTVSFEQISDCIPDERDVRDGVDRGELTAILNRWLGRLNEQNLYIFMRRYWYMDGIEKIADDLDITAAAVYLRIDRMKKSLARFLREKGVTV